MARTLLLCALVALAGSRATSGGELPPRGALPNAVDELLTTIVAITADERDQLVRGQAVIKLTPADASKEVAVLGAVWIDAPVARYVEAAQDIEAFERGSAVRVTRRISTPPTIGDFAQLELADEDFDDLRRCRVGDCNMKLGETAVQRFRADIDWGRPDARRQAEVIFRELALEYVTGYLAGGNARLAVYRDDPTPTFVADEFAALLGRMSWVGKRWPDLHRFLLQYPQATLPDATDFLYWQEADFGLKPTIRISHLVIHQRPEETVVASKMLYASHYFWTALELRVLVPDSARGGFWYVTMTRSRADGLDGFFGRFVRRRVRNSVQQGVRTVMASTKKKLETRPR